MSAGSWRVAGRLARREVRRHPWRHALVVALIAIPVLAVFATFSLLSTWEQVEARGRELQLAGRDGAFGARVDTGDGITMSDGVDLGGDPSALPRGTVTEPVHHGADWFVTDRRRADGNGPVLAGAEVLDGPAGSRRAARVVVDQGRLPEGADEVLLTPALARAGHWSIGDEVESARTAHRFEVVGIGVLGDATDAAAAVVAEPPASYWTDHAAATSGMRTASGSYPGLTPWVETGIWLPPGATESDLLLAGAVPTAPTERLDERVGPGIALGATAVCAMAATVASAAFALASRRQLRSIGLLSSIGTDPGTIRRLLVLQGALPGLVAGATAIGIGAAAALVANRRGLAESASHVHGAQVSLSLGGAALAVALAVASGVAAAWQPARTASRIPALAALAGRRPVGALPTGVPLGGLVLWAIGLVLLPIGVRANDWGDGSSWTSPFALIIGTAAFALGAIALAPLLIVILDRAAGRAAGLLRLAIRGLTRQRPQSAAAVAAIGVALALPVGFLTANASDAERAERIEVDRTPTTEVASVPERIDRDAAIVQVGGDLTSPEADELTAAVAEVLGDDATVVESLPLADASGSYWHITAIPADLASEVLAPWAAEALADGALVRTNPEAPGTGEVRLRSGEDSLPFRVATAPSALVVLDGIPTGYLVSTDALGAFGRGRPLSGRTILRAGELTAAEQRALRELDPWQQQSFGGDVVPSLEEIRSAPERAIDVDDAAPAASLFVVDALDPDQQVPRSSAEPHLDAEERALLALASIASVVALAVLTIALSLRAYDGRDDQRAALAAGAPPATLRRLRAIEGSILALLGAGLALPLGWLAVTAAEMGQVRRSPEVPSLLGAAVDRLASPGWIVVPILLVPALVVGLGWWIVPAIRASIVDRRGPRDVLAPRW